jgi:hypothetical protein
LKQSDLETHASRLKQEVVETQKYELKHYDEETQPSRLNQKSLFNPPILSEKIMTQESKQYLKTIVSGVYQLQKLRIQTGNRIAANFRAKLGLLPSDDEKKLEKQDQETLAVLRMAYRRLTDGIVEGKLVPVNRFKPDDEGVITTYTELCLVDQYIGLEREEAKHFRNLEKTLVEFPIFTEYLTHLRGVGPALSAVIISELDPHKATYPSCFHKYAGLDVVISENESGEITGEGRSRKKHHLIEKEYVNSEGDKVVANGITFNPFLKTKLIGVLGSSFIRAGNNKYDDIYREYKFRLQNMPAHKEKTKLHINNMAIRYMIKQFLIDLHVEWRRLEGLPVYPSYSEGKLGIVHKKVA